MPKRNRNKEIKEFSHEPNKHNSNNSTDSSDFSVEPTVVKVGLGGVRKKTSIYFDSKLWKSFMSLVKKEGLSSCDILEKLVLGFLVGYEYGYRKNPTIYVTVDAPRVVKRVRRRQLVFEDEVVVCQARGCKQLAEFRLHHYNGNVYLLCGKHTDEYREFAVEIEPLDSETSSNE